MQEYEKPGASYVARVAVLASGSGSNLEALFAALDDYSGAEIVVVVSDREDAYALDRARGHGVTTEIIDARDEGPLLEILEENAIDWIVLAGYLRIIPLPVIDRYRNRILNIHPALLPDFGGPGMYGSRVHEAVLASGVSETGATVHIVDEEYDHGPIVAQERITVRPDETAEELAARVLEVEHTLLPRIVIAAVEGRIEIEGDRARVITRQERNEVRS